MKKILLLVILIVLTFWAIRPLLHTGYFPMHDDQQVARLYELDQSLKAGQFPPRWVSNLGFGFGYPLYNFYPPMVYYVGEIFHLLGVGVISSIKIVMILGFVLAAIFMYLFAKDILGREAGIISAVLYTYAPYHSVDLYVRGALAEFFSFVFFPLIFLTLKKVVKTPSVVNMLLFAFSVSGLILTHNLMVLPFFIFVIPYAFFLLFEERKNNLRLKSLVLCSSFLVSFGLTAYFSLPSILEKQYTLVDTILIRELANFRLHFVYLRQFWDSPWGYGGSILGPYDGLSFQIGKVHIILSIIGGLMAGVAVRKKIKQAKEILMFLALMFFSVYLMSFHSDWLWEKVQPLWYIQFPWRFLSITALFASIIGAYGVTTILSNIPNKTISPRLKRGITFWRSMGFNSPCKPVEVTGRTVESPAFKFLKYCGGILVIIIIIALNQGYFHPERFTYFTDQDLISKEDISWRVSKTSFEFVPKGVATTLSDIGTTQLAITHDQIPTQSFSSMDNGLYVIEELNLPHKKIYKITAKNQGFLTINTFNFPGWEAFLNNQETTINDQNRLKLITVSIPIGDHTLNVEFKNTPIRTIGNVLSLISILIIITTLLFRRSLETYFKTSS